MTPRRINPGVATIVQAADGSVETLQREIHNRHSAGLEIAAPYRPAFAALGQIRQRQGDFPAAAAELVRAHYSAWTLRGDQGDLNVLWRRLIKKLETQYG